MAQRPRTVTCVAAVVIALASCAELVGEPVAKDPVATTRAFLAAVKRGDCETAWTFFSRGTQENIAAQVKKEIRDTPYPMEHPAPPHKYCAGTYGEAKPGSARLIEATDETAVVSVRFASGTHFPLIPFLSTPYHEWDADVPLVREDGRWKVERARVEVGRPGWDLIEVGDVEVTYNRGGDPRRQWVEAEAVLRSPREPLEAALMDPQAWSRFFPLVKEVRALDDGDDPAERRVLLRFEAPDGAGADVTVLVKPYGHVREARLPWTKIQWLAGGHARRPRADAPLPTIYSASWELRPRHDGFWVTFSFVIQPDEWPGSLADELLAAPNVAGAVKALEREAARRTVAAAR